MLHFIPFMRTHANSDGCSVFSVINPAQAIGGNSVEDETIDRNTASDSEGCGEAIAARRAPVSWTHPLRTVVEPAAREGSTCCGLFGAAVGRRVACRCAPRALAPRLLLRSLGARSVHCSGARRTTAPVALVRDAGRSIRSAQFGQPSKVATNSGTYPPPRGTLLPNLVVSSPPPHWRARRC